MIGLLLILAGIIAIVMNFDTFFGTLQQQNKRLEHAHVKRLSVRVYLASISIKICYLKCVRIITTE